MSGGLMKLDAIASHQRQSWCIFLFINTFIKAHFTVSIGYPGEGPAFLSKLVTKGQATKDNVKMPVFVYRVCSIISLSDPVSIQQSYAMFRPNVTQIIHVTRLHTKSMIRCTGGSEWWKLCQAIIAWVENIKVKHDFSVSSCHEGLLVITFALTSCRSRWWCPDFEREEQWRRG